MSRRSVKIRVSIVLVTGRQDGKLLTSAHILGFVWSFLVASDIFGEFDAVGRG
jgi:hypothetical protein